MGQTSRKLSERLTEHKRAIKNKNVTNALAKHAKEKNHEIAVGNTSVVCKEINDKIRLLLEAYSIAANKDRKLNIAPASSGMLGWLDQFRACFPIGGF